MDNFTNIFVLHRINLTPYNLNSSLHSFYFFNFTYLVVYTKVGKPKNIIIRIKEVIMLIKTTFIYHQINMYFV